MKYPVLATLTAVGVCAIASFTLANPAWAANEEAAKDTARQSACFNCHSVEPGKKEKDGPTWRSVSEKYKGKDVAESKAKIVKRITTGEKIKFADGHEEEHKVIKTKDQAEIDNLVDFILALSK